MIRPRGRWTWRDGAAAAWLIAVLVLIPLVIARARPAARAGKQQRRGEVRDAPMTELIGKIEAGRLSRKPARYAEPLRRGR